ncbi:MAG: methyltransferase domain-containing protein [Desulfobaccales bacterium]
MQPPQITAMHSKHAIQRNFARRALSYDRYALIQQGMAAELLRLAQEAVERARLILEIGCGTGYLTKLLRQANPAAAIVAVDLDVSLLRRARERLERDGRVYFLAADGEAFAGGPYDLIVANSVFQWFTRPQETLRTYHGLLNSGGALAFSTLGPATFRELDNAFRQAAGGLALSESPEVVALSFSNEDAWRRCLAQAGFQEAVLLREERIELHPTVQDFLHALQATGATNPSPRPFSPRLFRHMAEIYQGSYGLNGAIPVTYEIIWALGRKAPFPSA